MPRPTLTDKILKLTLTVTASVVGGYVVFSYLMPWAVGLAFYIIQRG